MNLKRDIRFLKKAIVAVIGFTIVIFGVILFVIPGSLAIVLPAGLAILGTQFVWARRALKKLKQETEIVEKEVESAINAAI